MARVGLVSLPFCRRRCFFCARVRPPLEGAHTSTGGAKKRVQRKKISPNCRTRTTTKGWVACTYTLKGERERCDAMIWCVGSQSFKTRERESWNRWRVFHQGWSIGSTKNENELKSRSDFFKIWKKGKTCFSLIFYVTLEWFFFFSPPHTHTHIYNRRLCV